MAATVFRDSRGVSQFRFINDCFVSTSDLNLFSDNYPYSYRQIYNFKIASTIFVDNAVRVLILIAELSIKHATVGNITCVYIDGTEEHIRKNRNHQRH